MSQTHLTPLKQCYSFWEATETPQWNQHSTAIGWETRGPGTCPKASTLSSETLLHLAGGQKPFSLLGKACYSKQMARWAVHSHILSTLKYSVYKVLPHLSGPYGTRTHMNTKARTLIHNFFLLLLLILKNNSVFLIT